MPPEKTVLPVSAFSIYRKTIPKQTLIIKKQKKQKQPPPVPTLIINGNSVQSQVQPPVKKKRKIAKNTPEEPPQLIEIVPRRQPIPSKIIIKKPNKPNTLDDNPTVEASKLFQWLIAPLSPEKFFNTYWEQKTLHIRRTNTDYYKHILDSAGLDKILRNHVLHYTRNIDVVSYENGVKEVHNQEGRAVPSALWDYYANGCSIRVLNPQTYNKKVHMLLATLQEHFGSMVGANVYLTPPGSQGFAPHYDDIEAFVVQLEGRKHWKLYEPKDSDVLARYSSPNLNRDELGQPFMEVTLESGDLLYFPRGVIHEGRTDEQSHSLHITVSVYQQTSYADLLERILPQALKKAAEKNIEFRKGLPLNYLKKLGAVNDLADKEEIVTHVCHLIKALVEHVDVDGAADELGRKFMHDSMPPVLTRSESDRSAKGDGACLRDGVVTDSVEINLDTRVRLLRYYCVRLVVQDGGPPRLYYNTENATFYHGEEEQWLELDQSMVPVITELQNLYPRYVEVENLPLDDVPIKMQLVSDLWEHGLLVTEEPLEIID